MTFEEEVPRIPPTLTSTADDAGVAGDMGNKWHQLAEGPRPALAALQGAGQSAAIEEQRRPQPFFRCELPWQRRDVLKVHDVVVDPEDQLSVDRAQQHFPR